MTGQTWRLGHRPALDGLRGVAILLVVVAHVFEARVGILGTTGVTMFFTLSGFLITTLLLEERERTGRLDLRRFYWRRAARLLPALFVFLTVMGIFSAVLRADFATISHVWPALVYGSNWMMALTGDELGLVSHTWSLSVEEQFYLVWPLALVLAFRYARSPRRAVLLIALTGSLYAVVARLALWDDGAGFFRVYMGTDTRADGLLAGAVLAAVMTGRPPGASRSWLVAPLLLVTCWWFVDAAPSSPAYGYLLLPTVVPWITVVAIWCVAQGPVRGWLTSRPLTLLGRRSYGLYLWHGVGLHLLTPQLPGPRWIGLCVAIAVAWGLTLLSWRYVEAPCLRRRSAEVLSPEGERVGRAGAKNSRAAAGLAVQP